MNQALRNVAAVTGALRSNLPALSSYQPPPRTVFDCSYIPVQIKSATLIPGESNRWEYTVEIVSLAKDDFIFTPHDDLELFKAYNGWEATNQATQVLILDKGDPDDLPEGYTVDHCPTGLVTHATAHFFEDADGGTEGSFCYFLFSEPNVISGNCS